MKEIDEFLIGCEHDGSYIPVDEVKRLMKEYADRVLSEKMKDKTVCPNCGGKDIRPYKGHFCCYECSEFFEQHLTQPHIKCECIECGVLFLSDVHQDYCKACELAHKIKRHES